MKKQNTLEKKALIIILINILLRPNVVVFDYLYCSEGVKPDVKKEETSMQIQTPRNKQ